MTRENILLEGDFLFFDSNASPSDEKIGWSKEVPREVKVTFERNHADMYNAKPSFCLRLKDPTNPTKAGLYYMYLDRPSFCGTDCGNLDMIKPSLLCFKFKLSYKYLAVFSIADTNGKSCVLLRKKWTNDEQARWQNTIEEHLGARKTWSVTLRTPALERVILCLTETGLALNKSSFSETSFPTCVWHHSFKDIKIGTNYNVESQILQILAIGKTTDEMCRYEVKTSHGHEITAALQVKRPSLPIIVSPNILTQTSSNPLQGDIDAPPPCPSTPNVFVHTPIKTERDLPPFGKPAPDLPLPPPPPPPRRQPCPRPQKSLQYLKSLRRSYSMGEKDLLLRTKSRKLLLRGKTSVSGGYDSDSDEVYQLPLTDSETVKAADRGTLYMHKKWYKSFKTSAENSDSHVPVPISAHGTLYSHRVPVPTMAHLRSFSIGKQSRGSTDTPRVSQMSNVTEDDYWIREVSFTLQNILDDKRPNPDTMKLDWKQRTRLNFNLYPSGPGLAAGWQELGGFIGLLSSEISMVEHFCMVHRKTPVNVLLDHWQFVYNKQTKQKDKKKPPSRQGDCPPCTKSQLIMFLQEHGRLDILEICNLKSPKTL